MTKVSAQTFARGYKKCIQLEKALYRFSDVINRKTFYNNFEDDVLSALVNSVANTEEAAIGGVLKIQIKVSQNPRESIARVSFLIKSDTGVFL